MLVAILEVRDDRMVNVLLLLAQEERGHGVERVRVELVAGADGLEDVEDDPAVDGDFVGVSVFYQSVSQID